MNPDEIHLGFRAAFIEIGPKANKQLAARDVVHVIGPTRHWAYTSLGLHVIGPHVMGQVGGVGRFPVTDRSVVADRPVNGSVSSKITGVNFARRER